MQIRNPLIKKNFIKAAFLSVLVPVLLAGQAMGAVITWDVAPSAVDINTPTQVFTTGSFVSAGTAQPTDALVNGVTFKTFGTDLSHFTPTASNAWGGYTATNDYGTILNYGSYVDSATSPTIPYVLSGLTNNQQYKIEIWVPIWNSPWPIQLGDTTNGTNTGNANASPTVTNGIIFSSEGQYIFGTFTAVGTTQNIYAFAQSNYAGISAYELRAVPEPATTALFALGGLALVLRRRFRQRTLTA